MPPQIGLDNFTDHELAAALVAIRRHLIENGELSDADCAAHLAKIEEDEARYSPAALEKAWDTAAPKLTEYALLMKETL